MQPNYYAIIPANVRYSNVTANAKLLYGELTALTNKSGYCWASNAYFATLYKVDKKNISIWINQLKDAGFILVEVSREDGNTRKIWLTYPQKHGEGIHENMDTYPRKRLHNNTVNNTTNTGEQSSQTLVVVSEDDKPPKEKKFDPQPVYRIFKDELGIAPLNWKTNKTQRQSAENLLTERGEEQIRKALRFYKEVKEEPFCPAILSPYDLDSKWHKLLKLKN